MTSSLPVWRSLLYVPVTAPRFVEGAAGRGADAIILDLEDSVLPADKARARALLPEAAAKVSRNGAEVVVRINRPLSLALPDIEASVFAGIAALCVPKVLGPDHLRLISEAIGEFEAARGLPPGGIRLIAMVESLPALRQLPAVAAADSRLAAVTLGDEDLAHAAGAEPDSDTLLAAKQALVLAAAEAGILPLGFLGSIADYGDIEAFRERVARSRRMGFAGGCCIHPSQVAVLNEAFSPRPEELEKARRIIEAAAAGEAAGRGAAAFDGKMIDAPVVHRARRVLARQEALDRRHGA